MKTSYEGEVLADFFRFEVDGRCFTYHAENMLICEIDESIDDLLQVARRENIATAEDLSRWLSATQGVAVAEEIVEEFRTLGFLGLSQARRLNPGSQGMTGITLNVTHGCNLRCSYCFAGQGDYGTGHARMAQATARAAIDWLAHNRRNEGAVTVLFFGGEPMMNMPTVRDAAAYARERLDRPEHPVRLQMTTNGTLLNERNVKFLSELGIQPQISLDGPAEINDEKRTFKGGLGSYTVVAKGIARLKAATGRAALRATISSGRTEFYDTAVHFIDGLGATRANFEPASCSTEGNEIDAKDIETIKAEWSKITEECYQRARRGEIWPIGKFMNLLERIHWRKRSRYGCTAGMSAVAVDPFGDMYPCHRFVGSPAWKMGNVLDATFNPAIAKAFADNSVDDRESCQRCWARYLCAGRCVHEAMEVTGSIASPDPLRCDMMRHICSEALKLYVRVLPLAPQRFARPVEPEP